MFPRYRSSFRSFWTPSRMILWRSVDLLMQVKTLLSSWCIYRSLLSTSFFPGYAEDFEMEALGSDFFYYSVEAWVVLSSHEAFCGAARHSLEPPGRQDSFVWIAAILGLLILWLGLWPLLLFFLIRGAWWRLFMLLFFDMKSFDGTKARDMHSLRKFSSAFRFWRSCCIWVYKALLFAVRMNYGLESFEKQPRTCCFRLSAYSLYMESFWFNMWLFYFRQPLVPLRLVGLAAGFFPAIYESP